jgi:hypothetical protein
MKILFTNWVNLLGIFITVFLWSVIYGLIDPNVSRNLFQSIIASLIGICLYGIMFWAVFLMLLIILDLILIIPNPKHLKVKLIIEWIIISSPLIYGSIIYERQRAVFLIAVITFFITQLIREKYINKAVV